MSLPSELPQSYSRSYSLFSVGVAILILSIVFARSFHTVENSHTNHFASFDELPFLLPTFIGGLLSLIAAMRISVFARPWVLVSGGLAIFAATWVVPMVCSFLSIEKSPSWRISELLAFGVFRILGLFFATTGVLRLLLRDSKSPN